MLITISKYFILCILIAEDGNIRSESHKLITSVWNREELSEESIIIPIYRGANKSLARPTSRCILFDGENISLDDSLVIYI